MSRIETMSCMAKSRRRGVGGHTDSEWFWLSGRAVLPSGRGVGEVLVMGSVLIGALRV
jgi:hypothetical protein